MFVIYIYINISFDICLGIVYIYIYTHIFFWGGRSTSKATSSVFLKLICPDACFFLTITQIVKKYPSTKLEEKGLHQNLLDGDMKDQRSTCILHQAHALGHSAHWLWQFESLCVETQSVHFISSKESFFAMFHEFSLNRFRGCEKFVIQCR